MHQLRAEDIFIGNKLEVNFKRTNPDSEIFNDVYIPVKIIKEYADWFLCEVLPHKNPVRSYGASRPYMMTIHKHELKCGDVIAKRGEMR